MEKSVHENQSQEIKKIDLEDILIFKKQLVELNSNFSPEKILKFIKELKDLDLERSEIKIISVLIIKYLV